MGKIRKTSGMLLNINLNNIRSGLKMALITKTLPRADAGR